MKDISDKLRKICEFNPQRYKVIQETTSLPEIKYVSRETFYKIANENKIRIESIEEEHNTHILRLRKPLMDEFYHPSNFVY